MTLPFVFCLAYVFTEYVRPQEKYQFLGGLPLGLITLVGLIIALLLAGKSFSSGGPMGNWITALLVWALPCAFLAENSSAAMDVYWDTLKIVPVYFLIVAAVRTRTQLYLFVLWLLLIYFMHTNFSFRGWAQSGFQGAGAGAYVGSGFLHNPNDYGAWLSSFWGVSLLLALFDRRKVFGRIDARWIHAAGTGLFALAVLASSSRGSAVGVAAGVVYYVVVHVRSVKAKIWGVVLTALSVFAFLFLLSDAQSARFENMGSEEDASAQERILTWGIALRLVADYPVTGVGIGQFVSVGQRYAGGEPLFVQHNITLQALTELGFPGLALFLGMLIAFFVQQRKVLKRARALEDPLLEGLTVGVTVSMVSFLVNGQFITVLFYPFVWILMAVGGVTYNVAHASRPAPRTGARPPGGPRRGGSPNVRPGMRRGSFPR